MRVICMMGLPRSGKSTVAGVLAKQLMAPIVNRDSIRLALHGEKYLGRAEGMVKTLADIMVRALFYAGHDTVIVDETNLKRSTRDFWRTGPWATEFLMVHTAKELCIERAKAEKYEEIQEVIETMSAYYESLNETEERRSTIEQEIPAIAAALERARHEQPPR